jgi:hypothetical protein
MLVASVCVAVTGAPALAVHDLGVFELDGNATDASGGGTDWSAIWQSSAANIAFVDDGVDSGDSTYYKGGGSKDVNDVTQWEYSATDVAPDKNEITNAYAYGATSGDDMLIYFGLDRYSNDGDSAVGFWFFQDEVMPDGSGGFTGAHQDGDVFIVSEFTNGGVVAGIKIYEWNGSGLTLLDSGGDCSTAASGDALCARVNSADGTPAPWPYAPKPNIGSPGAFPARTFFEGGVDLSDGDLFGSDVPCFSSFLGETRSSQEPTAQLKDFAAGSLDTCASKAGTKFEDLNGDGDRDSGEPGIAGWTIYLDGEGVHLTDTTDSNGDYEFTGLEPGSYVVCEQQRSGWTQSYPAAGVDCSGHSGGNGYAIELDVLEQDTGNDFGNFRMATKSGTKYEDVNADGNRDSGEDGLSGWTIELDGTDGLGNTVSESDVTDSNGDYSIEVPPGSYEVCEVMQTGWHQSDPGGDGCYDITLTSNQAETGNDFGNYQNATKSGIKFEDLNGDGDRDSGEGLLSGWTIHLWGTDGSGGAVHETDVTDSNGAYSFSVAPGDYTVCEELQQGWTQSMPGAITTGIVACTTHGDGLGYDISLDSNETDSGNDFGNFQVATKSGTKFEDLNADGDRDTGEPGLANWTITLDDSGTGGNVVHQTALTDSTGYYEFQVDPGDYDVCETQQTGWHQSMPGGDGCYHISLDSGELDSGNDFGNYRNATKSGTKFEDFDGDGVRDESEIGVPNVTITLEGTDGAGNSVSLSDTTDSNGDYSIEVRPGSYLVCEDIPTGWTQSYPTSGADCGSNGYGYDITLTSNQAETGNDFGNFRLATKLGMKFEDLNADGDKDSGEPGLEGWTITLEGTDGRGNEIDTDTETGPDGSYSFSVPPGNYVVCEVQQSGWTQSMPDTSDGCYHITLGSNQEERDNDFGNFRQATKSGTKFNDLNRDGVRDQDEPTLEGWQINLVGEDGMGDAVSESTTTDADGNYSFTVNPGTYTVCEVVDTHPLWVQSYPADGADCSTNGGGVGYAITLTSNQTETGNDFGNFLPNPDIEIVKLVSVDGSTPAHTASGSPGDTATYTYAVTNTGEVPLLDVSVDDDILGHIGDIELLDVGETETLTKSTVLGNSPVTNIAVAAGHDAIGREVDDDDTDVVTVVLAVLVKTGGDTRTGLELSFLFMGLGVVMVAMSRRRRPVLGEDES